MWSVTKTIYLPRQTVSTERDPSSNWALAPFLDCFNHSTKANISTGIEDNFFHITAMEQIQKDSEVFISYGKHSDSFLLIEYGFVLGENELNTVPFSFLDVFGPENADVAECQTKCLNVGCSEGFAVSSTGVTWSLIRACLLAITDDFHLIVFEEVSVWPSRLRCATFEKMTMIVERKIAEFSKIVLRFKTPTLSKFYSAQIKLLQTVIKRLNKGIICEIYNLVFGYFGASKCK